MATVNLTDVIAALTATARTKPAAKQEAWLAKALTKLEGKLAKHEAKAAAGKKSAVKVAGVDVAYNAKGNVDAAVTYTYNGAAYDPAGSNTTLAASLLATGTVDGTYTLTTGIDLATANVFNAPRAFVPGGNDQINTLNDDDVLTGTGTNATLNVDLIEDSDTGEDLITPTMSGVSIMNVRVMDDDAPNLNLEDVTGLTDINVTRIEDANGFLVDNMPETVANISVDGSGDAVGNLDFLFDRNVTVANVNLELIDLAATSVEVDTTAAVALTATDGVELGDLQMDTAASLSIAGSGDLTISDLSESAQVLNTINASAFTGDLDIDLGAADVVEARIAALSGEDVDFTYTGGAGADYIRVDEDSLSAAPTDGDDDDGHDVIDGGAGANTLDFTVDASEDLVQEDTTVTNIQTVRIDITEGGVTADLDVSLIGGLTTVILRNDTDDNAGDVANFDLNEMTDAIRVQVQHASDDVDSETTANTNVELNFADASGTDDSATVEIITGTNTAESFNLTLDIDGANAAGTADAEEVENVTIIDSDNEDNTVDLLTVAEHTGTLTLSGGRAGDTFEVLGNVVAETVNATAQLSDTTVTLGVADQDVMMGSGDDVIEFQIVDGFDEEDTVDGGEGTDVVRAVWAADPADDLELDNVEILEAAVTANVTIDITNSDEVTTLRLMSDQRADDLGYAGAAGIDAADTLTLEADAIAAVELIGDADGATNDEVNGLDVQDYDLEALTISVQDDEAGDTDQMTVGALLVNNVVDLTIETDHSDAGDALILNEIDGADLESIVITSAGDVTVTLVDNTTALTSLDVSGVTGGTVVFTEIQALADDATINLANDGDNTVTIDFSGDTGADDLTITGGDGVEDITITNGDIDNAFLSLGAGDDVVDLSGATGDAIEILAGDGADQITGSLGGDEIDLGADDGDVDTVFFTNTAATDTIANFESAAIDDLLDFAGLGMASEADVAVTTDTADTTNGRVYVFADGTSVGGGATAINSFVDLAQVAAALNDAFSTATLTGDEQMVAIINDLAGDQAYVYYVDATVNADAVVDVAELKLIGIVTTDNAALTAAANVA